MAADGARVAAMDIDADGFRISADEISSACLPVARHITNDERLKRALGEVESVRCGWTHVFSFD